MVRYIPKFGEYSQAALTASSKATKTPLRKVVIPKAEEVLSPEASGGTRFIESNSNTYSSKAKYVLYICDPAHAAAAETIQYSDGENWTSTIQKMVDTDKRYFSNLEIDVINFFDGLYPFLKQLEEPFRALKDYYSQDYSGTQELVKFISFDDVFELGYPWLENDLNPKDIKWKDKWDQILTEGKIKEDNDRVKVFLENEEMVFNYRALNSSFFHVIDDSSPGKNYNLDLFTSTYYFIRLLETLQSKVERYNENAHVPILGNTKANMSKEHYNKLFRDVYLGASILEHRTYPFLQKNENEGENMNHGREIALKLLEGVKVSANNNNDEEKTDPDVLKNDSLEEKIQRKPIFGKIS